MTSVQFSEYGDTDKLAITEAAGQAEPGEGQVLVRVTAASINRMDAAVAAGYLSEVFPLKLPSLSVATFQARLSEPTLGRTTSLWARRWSAMRALRSAAPVPLPTIRSPLPAW